MDLKRSVAKLIRIGSKQERVLYRISHGEFPLIDESNLPFYRDVYDHLLRVVVLAENYRGLVNGLLDIHFNILTSKTNEAIKFTTVISTIMLPLSVIAGIYGMNFEYMPELSMKYDYFVTLGVMFLVAILLILYFW
jgi:magnesium transporter